MPKVRFIESVYQDGSDYAKDQVCDLSEETIRGLGNSVERLEEVKPQPTKAEKEAEAKAKADADKAKKEAEAKAKEEKKAVDAAPVDKQFKEAPKTK